MWLTRLALRNAIGVLMASLAIVLIGAQSVARLPIDLFPNLAVPVLIIGTIYPGASPLDVEQSVTYPLEKTLSTIDNVSHIQSQSREGVSAIQVWFNWGEDLNGGMVQAVQKISQILNQLPPGIQQPFILKFDIANIPVVSVTVSDPALDQVKLYDLAYNTIEPQLEQLPNVSQATVNGGKVRQINVDLDPHQLFARNLSIIQVVNAINSANLILPSGDVKIGSKDYNLFTNNQITHHLVDVLSNIPVSTQSTPDGRIVPIFIKDFAKVSDSAETQTNIVRVNGQNAVYLAVNKQPGSNTVGVVDEVKKVIPKLVGLPPGVRLDTFFDQSQYIRQSIKSLYREIFQGAVLAILVILLFLGDISATVIISLAIPMSALVALTFLSSSHQTLNIFTFGGLALGIGRLVDDSIVELENIYRHFSIGTESRAMALLGAATEVAMPILASTITTVIVFLPILFMEGIGRLLLTPMALTITFALFASFFVSRTVTPLLCYRFLKPDRSASTSGLSSVFLFFRRFFSKVEERYEKVLLYSIHHRRKIFVGVLAIFFGSLPLIHFIGTEFFPVPDESQFTINIQAPPGTRIEVTTRIAKEIEDLIRKTLPPSDVRLVASNIGLRNTAGRGTNGAASVFTANTGPDTGFVQVNLVDPDKRQETADELMGRVRAAMRGKFPGVGIYFMPGGLIERILNFGYQGIIDVEIYGYDLTTAQGLADTLAQGMRSIVGVKDVQVLPNDFHYPELDVQVDRVKAAMVGLSEQSIASTVLWSFVGNENNPSIYTDPSTGNEYNIVVQLDRLHRHSMEDLKNVFLTNANGSPILLRDVATIRQSSGPNEIDRKKMTRLITISANPVNRSLGDITKDLQLLLKRTEIPAGFSVKLAGQIAQQKGAFLSLGLAVLMSILLVYMVLATQFRSLLDPFVIMFSVPMSFTGVIWIFFLTGTPFSTIAFMGVIMTVGIAVSNGVLLVDYTNRLQREHGLALEEAVVRSGKTRLRPVVMTSLATIVGLLPMALGLDIGSSNSLPLARAVIGGLTLATVFTLVLVPTVYLSVHKRFPLKQRSSEELKFLGE
ncbi:MAG: efflux RND transporter permease subunit [Nitrospiraceae bacterium]|jgi:CzcA family heavy metal efflux pump|nr:efflux RND transporter permease subunit [Nitrospiraceae bacterium]